MCQSSVSVVVMLNFFQHHLGNPLWWGYEGAPIGGVLLSSSGLLCHHPACCVIIPLDRMIQRTAGLDSRLRGNDTSVGFDRTYKDHILVVGACYTARMLPWELSCELSC